MQGASRGGTRREGGWRECCEVVDHRVRIFGGEAGEGGCEEGKGHIGELISFVDPLQTPQVLHIPYLLTCLSRIRMQVGVLPLRHPLLLPPFFLLLPNLPPPHPRQPRRHHKGRGLGAAPQLQERPAGVG
jgi:hypothetical protein